MSDVKEIALTATAIITSLSAVFGLLGWLTLPRVKQWLHREIAAPVQETHDQVKNHHQRNLRDDLDILTDEVTSLRKEVGHVAAAVTTCNLMQEQAAREIASVKINQQALNVVMDDHLTWSKEWTEEHGGNQ